MLGFIAVIALLLVLIAAVLWLSARFAYPITRKGAFERTTTAQSFLQFAAAPAFLFFIALATGYAHQVLVGRGCLDLSQPLAVEPNSRAAKIGLVSGDTLVRIDGAVTDCLGDLRLISGATSASLIVERSMKNGGGQIPIALSSQDSLQNLFRNGLHLPILRHPSSWRQADFRSREYFSTGGQQLFAQLGLTATNTNATSVLLPSDSAVDLFVFGVFSAAFLIYLVPCFFALKFLVEALNSNNRDAILSKFAESDLAPVRIAEMKGNNSETAVSKGDL